MRHHSFSRYTVINISKRDFSVFINARIRPFLQIRSHIVKAMIKIFTSVGLPKSLRIYYAIILYQG